MPSQSGFSQLQRLSPHFPRDVFNCICLWRSGSRQQSPHPSSGLLSVLTVLSWTLGYVWVLSSCSKADHINSSLRKGQSSFKAPELESGWDFWRALLITVLLGAASHWEVAQRLPGAPPCKGIPSLLHLPPWPNPMEDARWYLGGAGFASYLELTLKLC